MRSKKSDLSNWSLPDSVRMNSVPVQPVDKRNSKAVPSGAKLPKPHFLSVKETEVALGVKRAKITQLLDAGMIRSTKLGRRRLICRKSVAEYAKALLSTGGQS